MRRSIQSNSCLVEGLTVADNIFVLCPTFKDRLIRSRLLCRHLQPMLDQFDPGAMAMAKIDKNT